MQTRTDRLRLPLLALAAALLFSPALMAEKGAFLEKAVDVPRADRVEVGLSYDKGTLVWVESQNDPGEKDIKDAADRDPGDKTWIVLRFHYKNEDYVSHHLQLRAILLGENGEVFGEAGRSGTLDAQQKDDTISFPMRVKTLDWPKAKKLKILATFAD
jgi:hypothetical protein